MNTLGFVKLSGNKWKKIDEDKAIIKHHGHGFTVLIRFLDTVFFRFHVMPLQAKFKPALNFKFNENKSFAFVDSPIKTPQKEHLEDTEDLDQVNSDASSPDSNTVDDHSCEETNSDQEEHKNVTNISQDNSSDKNRQTDTEV